MREKCLNTEFLLVHIVFGLNTEIYEVNSVFSQNVGKDEPEKTPFLDPFLEVYILLSRYSNNRNLKLCLHNKYLLGGLGF